ncbi:MAG: ComEC/Rec2 family competence protein [Christensenellales bacterium]
MLRFDFINVGDGDAILVRQLRRGKPVFILLIDCGLPSPPSLAGSKRQSAAEYLRQQSIRKIDLLVITHLHLDHFGGLADFGDIQVAQMLCAWLPSPDAPAILGEPSPQDDASVLGLYASVTAFFAGVRLLERGGCACRSVVGSHTLSPTPRLRMSISMGDEALMGRQREAFHAIQSGDAMPHDTLLAISKERNNASLRLSLSYAGRRILLPGDAYGAYWQDAADAVKCDILKVPHHGDEKALTRPLMQKLRPTWALISGLMGSGSKHRPAPATLGLLRRFCERTLCLENDTLSRLPAASRRAIVLTLRDSGRIRRQRCR